MVDHPRLAWLAQMRNSLQINSAGNAAASDTTTTPATIPTSNARSFSNDGDVMMATCHGCWNNIVLNIVVVVWRVDRLYQFTSHGARRQQAM
ncbi:hypothetical protein KSP9073_02227 [Kushneria phyllosphaerae]|uniref:Uncharacterized protein n=1 Tax=Kushneria phyllosphaerae TaxID=2100822 RepID=A0A2R8CN48_9GAMM|nr:hypothetical protein KSP9073_02227 [Kushneria phyllosphaerae]